MPGYALCKILYGLKGTDWCAAAFGFVSVLLVPGALLNLFIQLFWWWVFFASVCSFGLSNPCCSFRRHYCLKESS